MCLMILAIESQTENANGSKRDTQMILVTALQSVNSGEVNSLNVLHLLLHEIE